MENRPSELEIKRAKSLHSILLFNFIVVHVFVFVIAIGFVKTSWIPLILFPFLSIGLLLYVIMKARTAAQKDDSWFVRCHCVLAAKRARLFLWLFVVTGTFTAALFFGGPAIGMSKLTSGSLAFGIGLLPFMVALLALITFEYDAEHQATEGKVPKAALELSPKELSKNG